MQRYLSLLLFLIANNLFSQNIIYKDFNSLELGDTRTLKIYIPESYEESTDRLYPLSILFDGDYLFDVYTGNAKLFALKDKAPEQIIVGILQNRNKERFTDCAYDKVSGLPTEESDKFYRFVRMELLQYMETNYRLSPFRTLVGNTLTANFINYFVVENEMAFDAYININPYYNPDMPTFLQNKLSTLDNQKVYYYMNSGGYNSDAKHKRIEEIFYVIKSLNNPNIIYKYDNFKWSTKTASIGQAISAALAHIFDIYSAISRDEFALNIKNLSPPDAIAYLENKYVEIEYLFGTNKKIRERDIYAIESIVIDQENGEFLVSFGDMIQSLYPESPLSDYYIGLFYEKNERYKQALKNYKNGYAKMNEDSDDAEAFYQNIERILKRQDEIIEEERLEEERIEAEKEQIKQEKEAEKLAWEKQKEAEKEIERLNKEAEKQEWEKRKKIEKENEEAEKAQQELNKEAEKAQQELNKEAEKAAWEEQKETEKEQKISDKKAKQLEWEKRKNAEEEMRKKFRKKDDD